MIKKNLGVFCEQVEYDVPHPRKHKKQSNKTKHIINNKYSMRNFYRKSKNLSIRMKKDIKEKMLTILIKDKLYALVWKRRSL